MHAFIRFNKGMLNRLVVLSTRLTPRWLNAMIFGAVVKTMQQAKSPNPPNLQSTTGVLATDQTI